MFKGRGLFFSRYDSGFPYYRLFSREPDRSTICTESTILREKSLEEHSTGTGLLTCVPLSMRLLAQLELSLVTHSCTHLQLKLQPMYVESM